jgi:hypothetical protein
MWGSLRVAPVVSSALGLALVVVTAPRPAWAGPVVINSQARSVHVAVPSIDPMVPDVDETITAPDNAPFLPVLNRTLNQMGQSNRASAIQDSEFANAANVFSVRALGEARYDATGVSGIVFADVNFQVVFTLDTPRTYTLSGGSSFVDTTAGATNFNVILTGPGGGGGGGGVFSFAKSDFDPMNNDRAILTPALAASGTLAPGTYTLSAVAGTSGGPNEPELQATFDFTFDATQSNDGGGGNSIPLPAAFGPAATLLFGLMGFSLRRGLLRPTV